MKLERMVNVNLDIREYLDFLNKANIDNDDWVPFDSIESLSTFIFSDPEYDSERHLLIMVDDLIVADLYIKIRPSKPRVAKIEMNILAEWRRKGLGERLLSEALKLLDRSIEKIRIVLSKGNCEILSLAEACGFKASTTQIDMICDLRELESVHVPTGCSIEPIKRDQLREVTSIRNEIFDASHRIEELQALLRSKDVLTDIFVAVVNGVIVGYCISEIDKRASTEEGSIVEIAVRKNYREKGIGKAMLLMSLHQLKFKGCRRAIVNVQSDNLPALKLYSSVGFKPFKVKKKILEKNYGNV